MTVGDFLYELRATFYYLADKKHFTSYLKIKHLWYFYDSLETRKLQRVGRPPLTGESLVWLSFAKM